MATTASAVLDDPIARLEQMAKRQTAETDAAKAIAKARVSLVLGKDAKAAFFATLALRLQPVVDWDTETAATDGRSLFYNPDWVNELSPDQRVGLMAHEVMHCAMAHTARRGARDVGQFNIAADLAINPIVRDAGMALPPGGPFPGKGQYANLAEGLSAEEYYSHLPPPPKNPDGSSGQGNDPGGCGGVIDAGDPAQQQTSQVDWQVAVSQAVSASKGRGELPGMLRRLVQDIVEPKVPWQAILREFLSRSFDARDDYSWSHPNRRFIAQGLYLPALRSQSIGHVVVHVDCSGSTDPYMEDFAAELSGVLESRPCKVTILYGDTQIQGDPVEWEPADGPITMERRGGGGTDHTHLGEWLKQQDDQPVCVIGLTDGETRWPNDFGIPALWCITPDGRDNVPFGQVVRLT